MRRGLPAVMHLSMHLSAHLHRPIMHHPPALRFDVSRHASSRLDDLALLTPPPGPPMPTAAGSLTRAMLPCVARRLVRVAGCVARDRRCPWAASLPQLSSRHLAATRCTASDSAAAATGTRGTAPPPGGRAVGSSSPEKQGGQQLVDTQPVRGTRDFPPEDMRLRNWLFSHFREVGPRREHQLTAPGVAVHQRRVCLSLTDHTHAPSLCCYPSTPQVSSLFGFEEWDAPVVESEELYTRKAGEEITQQLYNFEDKGGRRLALRPELTPSLARIVLAKGKGLPLPAKWFAVGQCWRYERMTRGRRREHYQWNMDIVGVEGIAAEAELLAAITTFFARVGLKPADVGIRVSSRKVLAALLSKAGLPEASFAAVCVCVDKLEKVPRDQVQADLDALGVPPTVCDALLAAMALKSLDELEALLGRDADAVKDMRALWALAQSYGYADWLVFDATVVRGLSYYTGVVFEAFDRAASLR